uniref:SAM domain-containing protein n=2 Tax=Parascaris univalens TaxID=6257 RepID=A0A914ZM30_PARUN
MEVDGFAEANQLLCSALEQLDSIIANGSQSRGHKVSAKYMMDNHHVSLNGDAMSTTNDYNSRNAKVLNWNSTVENWNECGEEVNRNSGTSSGEESPPSDIPASSSISNAPNIFEAFLRAIDKNELMERPDLETQLKIMNWLCGVDDHRMSPSPSMSTVSCPEYPELQEKLHRLAMARDSLSLQVTVLTEQVGAQKEKIRDLENLLASKRNKLDSTEELLQDHADSCGDLESKKLDLMAEVSNLKLKYATLEREKFETERKLRLSQAEIEHLNESMQGFLMQHQLHPQLHNVHLQAQCPFPHAMLADAMRVGTDSANEMEQLRIAVQRLIVDNEQKNIQINSLRNALDEHCRNERELAAFSSPSSVMLRAAANPGEFQQPFDINAQLRKLLTEDVSDHIAHSSSFPTSLCSAQQPNASSSSRTPSAVQSSSSYTSSLSAASPQHSWSNSGTPRHQLHHGSSMLTAVGLPLASSSPGPSAPPSYRSPSSPAARQLAAELDELRRIGGEMQQHSSTFTSASLPRSLSSTKAASAFTLPRKKVSMASSGGVTGEYERVGDYVAASISGTSRRPTRSYRQQVNKWLHDKLSLSRSGKRSTSAPNLGPRTDEPLLARQQENVAHETEIESDDEVMRGRQELTSIENHKLKRDRTRSSLRNLLGKLTRSTSQEIRSGDFRRGSTTRSTASARLASVGPVSGAIALRPPAEQFVEWNGEQICEWMAEIGFTIYVPEVARYVRSGRHLLSMSNHEFDKELLMKNPLHRKRLRCILNSIDRGISDAADCMDVHQVLRWLDEIGLPQYRDNFAENLIDGQLLTALTAQDLVEMKITSALHHATIARGVQFLRSVDFCVHRLEKRFNPDALNKGPCPNEVERWSHHCTCQWLKTIDLAEFTPNLLCAGIHGALMVHEPTFTAESLAEVLQMPAHKTLLRRHLTTHFNQLLGQEIISHKRDILAQPFVAQLTPSLKIRLMKKGFSLSRKKGKNEVFVEPEELVCPPLSSKLKYPQHFSENIVDRLMSSNV